MLRKLSLFVGLAFSWQVYGVPFQSNKCNADKAKVRHPDNTQGVLFDEECTTAYVLPPTTGSVHIDSIAMNANLNFCQAVNAIPKSAGRYSGMIDSILGKIEVMIQGFEPQDEALDAARKQINELKSLFDIARDKHKNLAKQEKLLLGDFEDAKEALKSCKKVSDSESECDPSKEAVEKARKEYRKFVRNEFADSEEAVRKAEGAFTNASEDYGYQASAYAKNLEPLLGLEASARGLHDQLLDLYKQYAPLRGLTGQAVYAVDWSKLLNDYQDKNKSLNVSFIKVPILSSRLYASAKIDNKETPIPVLLHAEIPGIGKFGTENIAKNEPKIEPDHHVPMTNSGLGVGDASVSGQIVLSVVGSCPYFPQGLETKRNKIKSNEIAAHLVVNAVYEFPMKARRQYSATYNISQFMERIEKKSTQKGWFSSKNVHSVVEDSRSNDWFTIDFDANDPEFQYTAEQQTAISNEVKLNLIERAMKSIASMSFGGNTPPPLPNLPETEGSFQKSFSRCFLWAHCYHTNYYIDFLNRFGSAQAISEFKKTNNVWTREDVKQVAVLRRTTTLTFRTEK